MFHLILGDSGSIPGRFRARVFFSTIMDRNVRRCLEAGGEGGGRSEWNIVTFCRSAIWEITSGCAHTHFPGAILLHYRLRIWAMEWPPLLRRRSSTLWQTLVEASSRLPFIATRVTAAPFGFFTLLIVYPPPTYPALPTPSPSSVLSPRVSSRCCGLQDSETAWCVEGSAKVRIFLNLVLYLGR